ncbi:MAG: hypothetical protein IT319_05005 [Anaerolineae bacterium]|nr:hypothetical protein [Anaerolineae bacterium]
MVTIHLTGHVTDDGELIFDPPKDLPPGEVQITIEVPVGAPAEQNFTDEEIRELLTFTPKSGKEIVEEGLIGGWEDKGITDSVAWVEEQRRKRRERRQRDSGTY